MQLNQFSHPNSTMVGSVVTKQSPGVTVKAFCSSLRLPNFIFENSTIIENDSLSVMMTKILRLCSSLLLACVMYADWTDWRGPGRDGRSPEKNLPGKWSPSGENLA